MWRTPVGPEVENDSKRRTEEGSFPRSGYEPTEVQGVRGPVRGVAGRSGRVRISSGGPGSQTGRRVLLSGNKDRAHSSALLLNPTDNHVESKDVVD